MSGLDHQYHSCWFGSCEMSKVLLAGGQVLFFCPTLPVIIWTGSIDEGEDTLVNILNLQHKLLLTNYFPCIIREGKGLNFLNLLLPLTNDISD